MQRLSYTSVNDANTSNATAKTATNPAPASTPVTHVTNAPTPIQPSANLLTSFADWLSTKLRSNSKVDVETGHGAESDKLTQQKTTGYGTGR